MMTMGFIVVIGTRMTRIRRTGGLNRSALIRILRVIRVPVFW
jgi:hypothetical protein